ncbi:MAG: hypothetical protein EBR84_02295, partial [Actinobacteria bacterium]|nr:hypothetical protein [Actinomycetota bacterium]
MLENLQATVNLTDNRGDLGANVSGLVDSEGTFNFATNLNWIKLAQAIETLRPMQEKDGSIDASKNDLQIAKTQVDLVLSAIAELAPMFAHQAQYLNQVQTDIKAWADSGFQV